MVALPNVLPIQAAPLLGTMCSPAGLVMGHLQASLDQPGSRHLQQGPSPQGSLLGGDLMG